MTKHLCTKLFNPGVSSKSIGNATAKIFLKTVYFQPWDNSLEKVPFCSNMTVLQYMHKASYIQTWFEGFGVEELDWPALSPALNFVECVWNDYWL